MAFVLSLCLCALLGSPGEASSDDSPADRDRLLRDEPAPQEEEPGQEPAKPESVLSSNKELIDFERAELFPSLGILIYSSDFDADPEFCAGLLARAPLPWLSSSLLGLSNDSLGLFVALTISQIERETEPELDHPSSTVFFLAAGVDYSPLRGEDLSLSVQAGVQYANFGRTSEMDNGLGALLGVAGALRLSPWAQVSLNPQIGFGASGDLVAIVHLGIGISF